MKTIKELQETEIHAKNRIKKKYRMARNYGFSGYMSMQLSRRSDENITKAAIDAGLIKPDNTPATDVSNEGK